MRKGAIIQIRIISGVVLLLGLVLIGKLFQIQIFDHTYYKEKAESQYVHTVRGLYSRGSIFFTTKDGEEVAAATIQSGYELVINPKLVENVEDTYTKLNAITPIDHGDFIQRASRKESSYQVIKQEVSNDNGVAIQKLNIPGVQLYRTQWRYYPGDDLAARTIGFVGQTVDSDALIGRYGLERYYDNILERNNKKLTVNFFAEIFSNLGAIVFDNTPSRTGDVVTSLEPTVSRMLAQELKGVQDTFHSKITGGIIINPQTGEIYAMGVNPTYNLNDRTGATVEEFRNPLVEDVYEMGSIVKSLTMASGLDSGAVTPATTYDDTGCIHVNGSRICNWDFRARGVIPMQQVLNQSLNVGAAFVERTMGNDLFRRYFKSLKIGEETGIDLPNETYGLINNLNSPRDVEYATASFGQGIALTPVETVRALSALGNGGYLVYPHIATEIDYQDGTVKKLAYPQGDQIFSNETSVTISRMLTEVTDEALAYGNDSLPHYSVAVKTGTAQMADPVNGGYYADRYLHSFFGYFPSYDPKFLVFLYTVDPQGARYASQTLTDPFMRLVKFLINYYNLPPDR